METGAIRAKEFDRNPRYTYATILREGISGEVLTGGEDTFTHFKVVIKRPNKESVKDVRERHAENIVRECEALTTLDNRGEQDICRPLDHKPYREDKESPDLITDAYLVTTFAEGRQLADLAKEYQKPGAVVPWIEVLTIFERLTALLARAHDATLVYNDVKLEHIFWDRASGQFKLIDWGNVVFYEKEPEKGITPAGDIRQVGAVLYKLITSNNPPSGPLNTLQFGRLELPLGFREIVTKALKAEYLTMDALCQDFKQLSQQEKAMLLGDLSALEQEVSRAPRPDPQQLRDRAPDLQQLRDRAADWRLHIAFPARAKALLEDIDERIRQWGDDRTWKTAREYLKERTDYAGAYPLLKGLADEHADVGRDVDLPSLADLCEWLLTPPYPSELDEVLQQLAAGNGSSAFETLLQLYKSYALYKEPAPEVVYRAVHLLSRKQNVPTIRANLEWLYLEIKGLEDNSKDRAERGRLGGLTSALDERIGILDKTASAVKAWQEEYRQIVQTLDAISDPLQTLNPTFEKLANEARWLSEGAARISRELAEAHQSVQNQDYDRASRALQDSAVSDPSNPALAQLASQTASLRSTQARLAELDREIAGEDIVKFTALREKYRKALQESQPGSVGQWDPFENSREKIEQLSQVWDTYEANLESPQGTELVKQAIDLAQPFPPLWAFLADLKEKRAAQPWKYECRSEFTPDMTAGVNAWRAAQLPEAKRFLQAARRAVKSLPPEQREKHNRWSDWLDALIRSVDALRAQNLQDAEDRHKAAQGVHKSEETTFVSGWIYVLKLKKEGEQAKAQEHVDRIKRDHPQFVAYHGDLNALVRELDVRPSPSALDQGIRDVEEYIKKGQMTWAYERLMSVQTEPMFAKGYGPVYLPVLKSIDNGLRAWRNGNYEEAKQFFEEAASTTKSVQIAGISKKLGGWIDERVQRLRRIVTRLVEARQRIESQKKPDQIAWDALAAALQGVCDELAQTSYSDEYKRPADNQKGLHSALYTACQQDSQRFVDTLNQRKATAGYHPFWEIYRAWAGAVRSAPSTFDKDLKVATSPVEQQKMKIAREKLHGLRQGPQFRGRTLDKERPFRWVWVALGIFLIVIFAVAIGPLIRLVEQGDTTSGTKTPFSEKATPSPTWTPNPTLGPDKDGLLLSDCQEVQGQAAAGEWEAVLQKAEAARERFPEDFGPIAQTIQPQCDFWSSVAQAGIALAQRYYDEKRYPEVEDIVQRVTGLHDVLDTGADFPLELVVLGQCARYQQAWANYQDRPGAQEALDVLKTYQNQDLFYYTFLQCCRLSFAEAEVALATPTPELPTRVPPTAVPACPTVPTLVEPLPGTAWGIGTQVLFSWQGGALCDGQYWVVTLNGVEANCSQNTDSSFWCQVPSQEGVYEWRVEIRDANQTPVPGMMTPPREITLQRQQHPGSDPCSKDSDGDGVKDCLDNCPKESGSGRTDGCPEGGN